MPQDRYISGDRDHSIDMSAPGASRTCHDVRFHAAIGGRADRAELKQILTESIRWALTDTGAKPPGQRAAKRLGPLER
jgi:hypothetical protein